MRSLDAQLLAVAEGEAVVGQGAQHDGRVHHILLKAEEPHIQSFEPHQNCVLCKASRAKSDQIFVKVIIAIIIANDNSHVSQLTEMTIFITIYY